MTNSGLGRKPVRLGTDKVERHHWRMGLAADRQVSSSACRLAAVIEDHMNRETGEAWPGQEELARRAAMSERQVRQHLAALVEAGWMLVLSGKDRARPKTRRGLHYRPTWPDAATRERCARRDYYGPDDGVETGGNPPVSEALETGGLASQKRKSEVAKPEVYGRNTGGNPPVSYEYTYDPTYTGRGRSRAPEENNNLPSEGSACAGPPVTGERGEERKLDHLGSRIAFCAERDDDLTFAESAFVSGLAERRQQRQPISAADLVRLQDIQARLSRLPPPDAFEDDDQGDVPWVDDATTSEKVRTR